MRDNIAPKSTWRWLVAGKKSSFESQLEALEKIVDNLEGGELTLEESLAQFEQGIKLTRECQETLDNAQQKVAVLTKDNELVEKNIE